MTWHTGVGRKKPAHYGRDSEVVFRHNRDAKCVAQQQLETKQARQGKKGTLLQQFFESCEVITAKSLDKDGGGLIV
jgi:hypothetical protein